jgi:hypothetical protein
MFKNDWIEFHPKFSHFALELDIAGYFDNRPSLHICLGWGNLFINFPIKTKYNECDPPSYGVYFSESAIVFKYGKKSKFVYMPWSWEWVRTSALKKDNTWENETRGNRKDFWQNKWHDVLFIQMLPYKYVLNNGSVQERIATIKVEEREWRWKCCTWLKYPRLIRRAIQVDFNGEVGEGSGSWKGGTVGCSYDMLKGESPEQCLRRMEKDRRFNR